MDRRAGEWGVINVASASTLVGVLLLAGCGPGRDPVDTPVAWWHQLQGGAIAEQRPPPPGVDAPYPLIGTTPTRPVVTSAAARDALTASLIDQQGASHQLDTHDPILVATPDNPTTKPATPVPAPPPSTATLDAAGSEPPASGTSPNQAAPKPVPTPEQQEAAEPALTMPPPPGSLVVVASGPLPRMPAHPPAPPEFPGFDIPATTLPALHADLSARPAQLSNLAFAPGSDVLSAADQAALHRAASRRGGAPVRIDGHGDAQSDTPDGQVAALRLALARAAAAAAALERLGVPPQSIELAASAFGRGGRVAVVQ